VGVAWFIKCLLVVLVKEGSELDEEVHERAVLEVWDYMYASGFLWYVL